jgi:hypothetical protein
LISPAMIVTKQGLGKSRAAGASCLLDGQDARRAELELTLPATTVDISLIEGSSTRTSDFEQESPLLGIEEVDLNAIRRAGRRTDKLRREWSRRHGGVRARETKST